MHETLDKHMLDGILSDNNELARHNQEHFDEVGAIAVNLMSAPGAGKTSLLASTLECLAHSSTCLVIEGDMVGDLDAVRLRSDRVPVHQISTGRSCHLNAQMVAQLLHDKPIGRPDYIFIENVGNLVCPAEFPLGEHKRVVLLSVTEGDDKPLKYPVIFYNADAVIFTKCDLIDYVEFDIEKASRHIRALNAHVKIFSLSVKSGQGLDEWIDWLKEEVG